MKSYLCSFIFFLLSFSSPLSLYSQESKQTEDSSPISNESLKEQHPFLHDLEDHLPFGWSDNTPHETESFEGKFLNMLLILGLLIGFMVLASWSLKRMMRSKVTQLNTASAIKVLESRHLSPRATLYLIEVGDQHILIAESPTTVTQLKSFQKSAED